MPLNLDSLTITPEILSLIAELDEFKGAWKAVGMLPPDRLSALRQVATIESIGAAMRINGGTLTDRAVEHLLETLENGTFATGPEEEAAGYAEVLEKVLVQGHTIELTEAHIKQLHRDMLRHATTDERHRGNYKTSPNEIINFDDTGNRIAASVTTATPFETPRRMSELVRWTQNALDEKQLHALLVIAIFVAVFLEIHPFQNGNGRLSRILTTLLMLRGGYAYLPYASLECVIEQTRQDYHRALHQTQATIRNNVPAWQPWLECFLRALHQQKQNLVKKLEREHIMAITLPQLSVKILDLTKDHGRLTISQFVILTKANRNTVKKHLKSLVSGNHLAAHGTGKGTWYGLA